MTPHYADDTVTLYAGDCLDVLRELPDDSVDSVVTDPPYGLEFMGREWDKFDQTPNAWATRDKSEDLTGKTSSQFLAAAVNKFQAGVPFQTWCTEWATECLRVLKPGGHLLAFGGTRTWHRLTCAIEDAGFEIRDSIAWLYGSGFPKSLDVSKAIDKAAPRFGMYAGFAAHYAERRQAAGMTHNQVCALGGFHGEHNHGGASTNWERGYGVPTLAQWAVLAPALELSDEWLPLIERVEAEREVTGQHQNSLTTGSAGLTVAGCGKERRDIPATPDAQKWSGWGTALKPAFEPIVVARKPITGTVAANVLTHGTGALNIDACRVGTGDDTGRTSGRTAIWSEDGARDAIRTEAHAAGRWPANVVLDDTQAAELDRQSGTSREGNGRIGGGDAQNQDGAVKFLDGIATSRYPGEGGASRFFPTFRYEPKAPTTERPRADGTAHPTVKPLDLMRWLARLVTPPGGTVLEPFAGSGTTAEACVIEGFQCIAIEREKSYLPLIVQRLTKPIQVTLI